MFTEQQKQIILKVKEILDESSVGCIEEGYYILTKKGYFSYGLCDLHIYDEKVMNKLELLSYEYRAIFKIYSNSFLFWFPHDENILKHRQEFINWIIEKYFN